jgi:hypothetical protein
MSPRELLEAECRRLGYEPDVDDSDADLLSIINQRRPQAA